jgi:hypothetical protein
MKILVIAIGAVLVLFAARTIFAATSHDLVALFIIGLVVSRAVDFAWTLRK